MSYLEQKDFVLPGSPPSMSDICSAINRRLVKLAQGDYDDETTRVPGITIEILQRRVYIMCTDAATVEAIERQYAGRTKRLGTTSPYIDLRVK